MDGPEEHDWLDDQLTEVHGMPPDGVRSEPYELLYRPEIDIETMQRVLDKLELGEEWRAAIDADQQNRKTP